MVLLPPEQEAVCSSHTGRTNDLTTSASSLAPTQDGRVSRIAAELRAVYGLRTLDSLQIAACLAHDAAAIVTNNRRLRIVNKIDVILLDEFPSQ